jgi:elongation factor G-like protein
VPVPSQRVATASHALVVQVDVTVPLSHSGPVYSIVGARRGEVVSETHASGDLVLVTAHIPVLESFGLADALRWRGAPHGLLYGAPLFLCFSCQLIKPHLDCLDTSDTAPTLR